MPQLTNLTPSELSSICLIIAVVALFMAIILTIIHYLTGLLAGFTLGIAAGTHAWWPMMQEWARDVMIPLVISVGSLLVWACSHLYERFVMSGVGDVMDRF